MSDDRLALHLTRLYLTTSAYNSMVAGDQAEAIRRDPQVHIDALVEAGVLARTWSGGPDTGLSHHRYRAIQPEPVHEHMWTVQSAARRSPVWGPEAAFTVTDRCTGCKELRNRLTDEWPTLVDGTAS